MKRSRLVEIIRDIRDNYGYIEDELEFADFLLEKIEEYVDIPELEDYEN